MRFKTDEDGYYWIRHEVPAGAAFENLETVWSAPVVGIRQGKEWLSPLFGSRAIADQFSIEVLSERLVPPVVVSEEERMAEEILELVEAEFDSLGKEMPTFDRMEMRRRLVELLKS